MSTDAIFTPEQREAVIDLIATRITDAMDFEDIVSMYHETQCDLLKNEGDEQLVLTMEELGIGLEEVDTFLGGENPYDEAVTADLDE